MARVIRRGSIVVALAALGIIVAAGREAKAITGGSSLAISQGGIVVVGGGGNGGDPAYTYQFELVLNGTLDAPPPSTSFTVDGLVGVYPFASQGTGTLLFPNPPGQSWSYSFSNIQPPTTNPNNYPNSATSYYTSDVTWTYNGPTSISSPLGPEGFLPQTLGIFEINTATNLPDGYPPTVLPSNINYSYSLNGGPVQPGGNSGAGSVGLQQGGIQSVPEPSTALAPLMVFLGLPLVLWLKRRRGVPRGQQAG